MQYYNPYSTNKEDFLNYLKYSNEKDNLIDFLINQLPENTSKRKVVITDIWAWNWILAMKLIDRLRGKIDFEYNFIEPSKQLIENFVKNCNFLENVNIINDYVENITIPKSDLIICTYVFQIFWDYRGIIDKLYNNLNSKWQIVIVNPNIDFEKKLKEMIGQTTSYMWRFKEIVDYLESKKLVYYNKKLVYNIRNVEEIINQTPLGISILSFILYLPFNSLSYDKKEMVINYFAENMKDWIIEKSDEMIIISN